MRTPFLETIRSRVLLGDGAMGTQLQAAGLVQGGCGELWNVDNAAAVRGIYERYRDAGSDVILTNTFGCSPWRLSRHGIGDRCYELNRAAADLAREVMGINRYVLGDVGPFGDFLTPLGEAEPEDITAGFEEQARAFLDAGVDGVIIETMTALDELRCAVEGVRRAAPDMPLVISLAFDKTQGGAYRTMMGITPEQAAEFAEDECADVVGCNCGTGMQIDDYAHIVAEFRARTRKPIIVQPNAGLPVMEDGRIVYKETPEMMAAGIPKLIRAGANIVGGCCGTAPEHIRLFRAVIDRTV